MGNSVILVWKLATCFWEGGASVSGLSSVIVQYSLQALGGGQALQEHSEGFRVGRRPRAVLQAAIRWVFYRGLWTHLYHGKLAAAFIFSWFRQWYANFETTFRKEEHFFKVDDERERDLAHHELQKGPWFQVNRGELAMAMAVVRCC